MKICVIHLGEVEDCLVASSINRGFFDKYKKPKIDWVVNHGEQRKILKYSDYISEVYSPNDELGEYDLLVNLSPSVHPSDPNLKFNKSVGFNFDKSSSQLYDILYGNKKTDMNIFQVYFRLSGMTWHGESYSIKYFPKTKKKKNTVAISVAHLKLRHYVEDELDLRSLNISSIPYRKSIFKKMDDINRYSYIITDDWLTMNLAVYLRKNVHFLETLPLNTRPEFFGLGRVYRVPSKIVK